MKNLRLLNLASTSHICFNVDIQRVFIGKIWISQFFEEIKEFQ